MKGYPLLKLLQMERIVIINVSSTQTCPIPIQRISCKIPPSSSALSLIGDIKVLTKVFVEMEKCHVFEIFPIDLLRKQHQLMGHVNETRQVRIKQMMLTLIRRFSYHTLQGLDSKVRKNLRNRSFYK